MSYNSNFKKRIRDLSERIHNHNFYYYCKSDLENNIKNCTDEKYDELVRELKTLELNYPEFKLQDSPNLKIKSDVQEVFPTKKHIIPMLSLGNAYSFEDLKSWEETIQKMLGGQKTEYICELKIDGVAVSLLYENGIFKAAITRGDGNEGEEITPNLKTIDCLPLEIKNKSQLEIRGEVYLSRENFDTLNKIRLNAGEKSFKNPRNASAGSLRLLDSTEAHRRNLDIFIYTIVSGSSHETHFENIEFLNGLGFPINSESKKCNSIYEVLDYCRFWEVNKNKLDYDIDGIVVKVNSLKQQKQLGFTSKTPRWAVAFKFSSEQAKSILREIEIGVGRTGILTPVAILDPVELNNTTVSRATLHNYDHVERLNLHIGDYVILEKGGEIIPKIVSVEEKFRDINSKKIEAPLNCPSCGKTAIKHTNDAEWRCLNHDCRDQVKERILHYVSRRAMDIETVGPALIEQLLDKNLLKNPADLYLLNISELSKLERMGEKSAKKVLSSIEKSKSCELPQFVFAIGIANVGEKTASILSQNFGSLNSIMSSELEELKQIEEIGPVIAESIVDFFNSPLNIKLIDELLERGVSPKNEENIEKIETPFTDKTVVLTGTLSEPRDLWKNKLFRAGAKVTSTISKKTDYVIAGENPGSKLEKANKLSITVMEESLANIWLESINN